MKETPKCRPNLHDIFRFRGRPDRGQLQGVGTKPRPRRHGESRNGSLRAHDRLVVHQATADQLRIARSVGRSPRSGRRRGRVGEREADEDRRTHDDECAKTWRGADDSAGPCDNGAQSIERVKK